MLRVVVAAPPEVQWPQDLACLPAAADLVELRLDLLAGCGTPEELRAWIAGAPRPVIATVRSAREGGKFSGGPGAAAAWLTSAAEAGAAWLDAEHDVRPLLGVLPAGVGVIASAHGTRFELPLHDEAPLAAPPPPPPEVVKLAGPLAGAADLERYRASLRSAPRVRRAWMPTGPLSALRVLDRAAALLYGSAGTPVVGGQAPLVALLDELRAGEVTPDARLFGLVGTPPAWSPSPALHNAVFRARGIDALYIPLPGLTLDAALSLPFVGLSVTTPHKQAALSAGAPAGEAEEAGAANTLARSAHAGPGAEHGWNAWNTDLAAVACHVPQAGGPRERGVVYGAGGYARAALVALRRQGYAVALSARDATRGRALAQQVGAAWIGARYVRQPSDRVLVNATPAGASGEPIAALDTNLAGLRVLDAPYAADGDVTWLAAQAGEQGAEVVEGLDLLLAQAGAQAQHFAEALGRPIMGEREADRLGQVLELALRPRSSLVLVGLRGAGKSSVGRALARHLGRPFVDVDDEVERITGRSPAAWLTWRGVGAGGIEAFRLHEARALAGLVGRRGLVVATGGGILERHEHVERLRRLGCVAWLDVSAEQAAARVAADPTPRPALTGAADMAVECARLKARRDPAYAEAAHLRLDAARPLVALVATLAADWTAFERDLRRTRE